jgi:beta-xylosidase
VRLAPGETTTVTFRVPADVTSFTGLAGRRVVDRGAVQLRVARSSADVHAAVDLNLVGPLREVDHTRRWTTEVT